MLAAAVVHIVAGTAMAATLDPECEEALLLAAVPVVLLAAYNLARFGSPIDFGDEVVAPLARHFERVEAAEAANDHFGRAACGAHGDVE